MTYAREELTLNVNGRAYQVRAQTHHTLLQVLRDSLKLFGSARVAASACVARARCCVDGKPVSSCLLLAPLAEGKDILTIEGLESADGTLHVIQQAYLDHTAFQCSYCTPGSSCRPSRCSPSSRTRPARGAGLPGRHAVPLRQLRQDHRRGYGCARPTRRSALSGAHDLARRSAAGTRCAPGATRGKL